MDTKQTPCKDCLIYPICRNRYIIRCTPLHTYIVKSRNHIPDDDLLAQMDWWIANIQSIMPKVESVSDEKQYKTKGLFE